MFKKLISLAIGSLLMLALGWPAARPALAAPAAPPPVNFTVDSFLDAVDDSPGDGFCRAASRDCTLRAAVMEANATAGDVDIHVPSGTYLLALKPDVVDDASSGDLNLTAPGNISLLGTGAATTIIDAGGIDRVLTVAGLSTASVSGVTLRGGAVTGNNFGGGILNWGTLSLDDSSVNDNRAAGFGGGLENHGSVTITHSTVSRNGALFAGGIDNSFGGALSLINTTLSNNSARADGGGIYNDALSSLTLINSTLSQNQSVQGGGALYNIGATNIYNTTIVFNWADANRVGSGSGGGVNVFLGTVNLRNSLVAGNGVGDIRVHDDCTGTLHSYGQNLFGVVGDATPCTINVADTGNWDNLNSLDRLGPLQDNGGPTLTHALLAGSNAIDTGDPAGCIGPDSQLLLTDQRGLPRTVGAACDIGAFEFLPAVAYLPFVRR